MTTSQSLPLPELSAFRSASDWTTAIRVRVMEAPVSDEQMEWLASQTWGPETANVLKRGLRKHGRRDFTLSVQWSPCPAGTGGGFTTVEG